MDFNPLDLILHLDVYLDLLVTNYGPWIYAILFLVIFCETGLVVMPFLPGDSLLFIAGAVAAAGIAAAVVIRIRKKRKAAREEDVDDEIS